MTEVKIISVGFGGFLGALARYYLYAPLNSNSVFPWGTLTVNLLGSFLLAFFLTVALRYFYHRSFLVLAVSTGFTGSFTTFSAVSVEMVKLAAVSPALPVVYIAASFSAGLFLAFAGRRLGNIFSSIVDGRLMAGEADNVD
ncbi:MAG: fluoride efflux transporter FluC [Bacillota bacterium]